MLIQGIRGERPSRVRRRRDDVREADHPTAVWCVAASIDVASESGQWKEAGEEG